MASLISLLLLLATTALATALPASLPTRQVITNPFFKECGYGINATIYDQAINLFCTQYNDVHINTAGIEGTFVGITSTIPYAPSPGEEGQILLEILAQPFPSCGTQVVDYNTCVYNFHPPINQCNAGSSDGKQGGIWYDPCLMFRIDPTPDGC